MTTGSSHRRGAHAVPRRSSVRGLAGVLLATALVPAPAAAQSLQSVEIEPSTVVTLEGTTNLGRWRCEATDVRAAVGREVGAPAAVARLPVDRIRCASAGMEADLREALRASQHPEIVITPRDVTVQPDGTARVRGTIEVAGRVARRSVSVRLERRDGRLRLVGELEFDMGEFDIDPPTALLGLIRVRERVLVRYDVRVAPLPDGMLGSWRSTALPMNPQEP